MQSLPKLLQKIEGGFKAISDEMESYKKNLYVLSAIASVLHEKGIITDDEVIQKLEQDKGIQVTKGKPSEPVLPGLSDADSDRQPYRVSGEEGDGTNPKEG